MAAKSTTKCALLVLTQSLNDIKKNLNQLIEKSLTYTSESLFICINPINCKLVKATSAPVEQHKMLKMFNKPTYLINHDRYLLKLIIQKFYTISLKINPKVNVNCLLNNIVPPTVESLVSNDKVALNYEIILTDLTANNDDENDSLRRFCLNYFKSNGDNVPIIKLNVDNKCDDESILPGDSNDLIYLNKFYDNGIVAGTFDRLHVGHKILLSESVLLVSKRLLIGVTDELMIKKKTLYELIEPLELRINSVRHFLSLIAPHLNLVLVPIHDPFGPSITEKDYQVSC